MRATLVTARAMFRSRRVQGLALALFIALAVGVPIAGAAGARRTSSVLTRFRTASAAADISVSLPDDSPPAQREQFMELPAIAEEGQLLVLLVRPAGSHLQPGADFIAIAPGDNRALRSVDRPLVLRGRAPDQRRAGEVLVDEGMAQLRNLQPGDRFEIESMSRSQLERAMTGADPGSSLEGPRVELTVAGVARFTFDAHTAGGSRETFATTRAFVQQYGNEVAAVPGPYRVRLRGGAAAVGDFELGVRRLFPPDAPVSFETAADEQSRIEDAVELQRSVLVAFTLTTSPSFSGCSLRSSGCSPPPRCCTRSQRRCAIAGTSSRSSACWVSSGCRSAPRSCRKRRCSSHSAACSGCRSGSLRGGECGRSSPTACTSPQTRSSRCRPSRQSPRHSRPLASASP